MSCVNPIEDDPALLDGLPDGWSITLDHKGKKQWLSPDVEPRKFKSLSDALEYAHGDNKPIVPNSGDPMDTVRSDDNVISVNEDTSVIPENTVSSNATDVISTEAETSLSPTVTTMTTTTSKKATKKKRSASIESISRKKNTGGSNKKIKSSASSKKGASASQKNTSTSKQAKSSGSSNYESDPETSLDIPPDFDESTNSGRKYNRCTGTVHWDPNSIGGSKVGYRIRVYDFNKPATQKKSSSNGHWKHGRIIRYDPISHKHKVAFFGQNDDDDDDEQWLMLKDENIHLGGDFVWALVKGFAWWPAQVLHCHFGKAKPNSDVKDLTTQPLRDGFVLVEFFDSDEVASIRNTSDFLRPFNKGLVDDFIAKNKKKRNVKAVESGVQEEIATQEVRNDAARFYAERAFECANRKANYFLGMKVEVFRSDINYPLGAKLIGTVRQYSLTSKKWLVAYDSPPVNDEQYSPSWINLMNRSISYKVIDSIRGSKRKYYEPNDDDIFPFLFGHKDDDGSIGLKCRGCVADCSIDKETIIRCADCMGYYHPGCVDPPMSSKTAESIIKNDEKWYCNKCVRCIGCRELEITFGTKTVAQPKSLFLEKGASLNLCTSCIPMYEKDMYCPTCAHIWDDVRFQRIQKRTQKKLNTPDLQPSSEFDDDSTCYDQKDNVFQWKSPSGIDDSWFYPEEKDVWGYQEASMLLCEQCNLWVHAGCAELSEREYAMTNEGNHPIYSKEFLCRMCCKQKCVSLVNLLVDEDRMGLFAEPVTDKVAHNYSDIIKNPMDLQTMMTRAQGGAYRNYAWLRESFELMVYNALTFNIGYTLYWKEAKRFYKVCKKKVFYDHGKGAPASKYKARVIERFEIADREVQAEKDRVKTDDTAEKKDLVAGSQVLKVQLGPLEKPCDPSSCVPCFEIKLSSFEALFCSWMDCCFSCGSSGAADTFLFCVDCGEAYHSFCCMAPIHSMNEAAVSGWRCPNCKLCEITGEVTDDDTKLIYCDMCDRAFCISAIEPPLSKVPMGLWICGQCIDCVKCQNAHYNGVVSRAYWSNDPSICRGCFECKKPKKLIAKEEETEKALAKEKKRREKAAAKEKKRREKAAAKEKKKKNHHEKTQKSVKNIRSLSEKVPEHVFSTEITVEALDNTKEELKELALNKALRVAQARGLPDGWTCFYGAANRKRWRSPPPQSRVFDSIPKALQYVERMKNKLPTKTIKKKKKKRPKGPNLHVSQFKLNLSSYQVWTDREIGYDDNTALMSDAETLLWILESNLGVNIVELFDPKGTVIPTSERLKDEPIWVFQRAARFVRFVKRLSKRNELETPNDKRGGFNKASQVVVCKMAASFIYVVCSAFNIDIESTIKSYSRLQELLRVPIDVESGTIVLQLPIKNRRIHRKNGEYTYKESLGIGKYDLSLEPRNIGTEATDMESQEHYEIASALVTKEVCEAIASQSQEQYDTAKALVCAPTQTLSSLPTSSSLTIMSVQNSVKSALKSYDESTKSCALLPTSLSSKSSTREEDDDKIPIVTGDNNKQIDTNSNTEKVAMEIEEIHDIHSKTTKQSFDSVNHDLTLLACTSGNETQNQSRTESSSHLIDNTNQINEHQTSVGVTNVSSQYECTKPLKAEASNHQMEAEKLQEVSPLVIPSACHAPIESNNLCDNNPSVTIDTSVETSVKTPEGVVHSTDMNVDETSNDNTESLKFQENHTDAPSLDVNLVSAQEFDVANALLGLTSPTRSVNQITSFDEIEEKDATREAKRKPINIVLPWQNSTHIKVSPMCGWSFSSNKTCSLQDWKDPRSCCLCLTCGDDDAGLEPDDSIVKSSEESYNHGAGRLLPLPSGGWVHTNCAIWSSEVWESPTGYSLNDVYKARSRSAKLKCFGCGRPGATLGCQRKCMKNFHFACAKSSGVTFTENHKLYCSAHKSYATDSIREDFSEPMKPLKVSVPNDMELDHSNLIRCGSLVVHSLGQIQTDIDGFHSKHYITPPGYTSTRIFWSYIFPKSRTLYFMKIERSSNNLPLFILTTADDPSTTFHGDDVKKVYAEVMQKVEETNKDYFSHGDPFSIYPMKRKWKKGQKAFCLNGPQFWGYGMDNIRKSLELLPEAVACAVPLTEKSTAYRFCFQHPSEEAVTELQRKRAVITAEKALENASGCARTEGKKAVDKSTSSGRITRALVRQVEEDDNQKALVKTSDTSKSFSNDSSKHSFESNQEKYMEMKKYPMEQRLAAKRSHIHGWGLFAKKNFPKNSMIAEYMGETIGQTIADKREKKYEVLGMGSCYMFRLDPHNIVDATNIGCMARFMNHCCAANAYANVVTVNTSLGMEKKIVVFANKDIKVGEEITYDYQFPVEDGSLRCTCGAPNCIGRMN